MGLVNQTRATYMQSGGALAPTSVFGQVCTLSTELQLSRPRWISFSLLTWRHRLELSISILQSA